MGKLPMTKEWKAVIGLITGGADPAEVAAETAIAAEHSLVDAGNNPVIRHAFWLLTQIPVAARADYFGESLRELGLSVHDSPDLVEVSAAMLEAIDNYSRHGRARRDDLSEIAAKTATESLISMASRNGTSLFGTTYAADDGIGGL